MNGTTPDSRDAATALPPDIAKQYPFAPRFVTLPDGQRMHYIDEGQGPVVLLLHGNPTWSFMYRNLVRALSPHFRCIAPDHIGCGLSDKPQHYDYTLARHILNAEYLLDSLGIGDFNLVAHDWGGAIGSGVAGRRPERVGRIMLMNTAAFRSLRIPLRIAVCKVPLLGALLIRGLNAFAGGAVHMASTRPLPEDVRRGYLYPYRNWRDRVANLRFVQDIPLSKTHPSYAELARVEDALVALAGKPMLLCWGMRDWCFSPKFLDEWIRRFPAAKVERFAAAGHYLTEDASEEVCESALEFMQGA
ncbi:MAG: alpha/beta fold hydrolase [Opitutales bacterium]|jgi:haloalkane dehalogenase